jgi:hydroxyacylglutathione hydrolase
MLSWHTKGFESSSIKIVTVQKLCNYLDESFNAMILDVRSKEELEKAGKITSAKNIHITNLLERLNEIPKDQTVYIFCGSGLRSMMAASILKREGWNDFAVVLGGIAGWNSMSCPIK